MNLYHHYNPRFTNWVIANGLLHEKFVVIDVGCQGGEHPRWSFLGDMLEFYGFDPLSEVIDALIQTAQPGRHYAALALGNEDGEREFYVSADTSTSSFLNAEIQRERRKVLVRRLDTLFGQGLIPRADHIKLDCEGFEPYVLQGGRKYLAASGPICVTSESGFGLSPQFPRSHFHAVNEILVEHRLVVFDVNIPRLPRATYACALSERPWPEPDVLSEAPHLNVGAPGALDVLFCRDLVAEDENATKYIYSFAAVPPEPASVDQLIKAMINFELHGLMDCAFDLLVHFRERLEQRLELEKASELLLTRAPDARNTADVINCMSVIAKLRAEAINHATTKAALQATKEALQATKEALQAVYNSRSWQITAPLRKLTTWLRSA